MHTIELFALHTLFCKNYVNNSSITNVWWRGSVYSLIKYSFVRKEKERMVVVTVINNKWYFGDRGV